MRSRRSRSLPLLSPEECGVLLGREGACAASSRSAWRPVPDAGVRRMTLELPVRMAERLDREARRVGVTPGALALSWIARQIEQNAAASYSD